MIKIRGSATQRKKPPAGTLINKHDDDDDDAWHHIGRHQRNRDIDQDEDEERDQIIKFEKINHKNWKPGNLLAGAF